MFMRYMGFTLNNITMLGLILAIGIVIDDAVVVHENIFRHMEEDGMDGMEAARHRHARDRPGGAGDQPVAGRHLRADRLHGRDRRPVLLELRPDRRLRGDDEPVRLVHPDADALQPLPEARAGRARRRPHAKSKSGFIYRMIDGSYGGVLRLALRHKFLVVLLTVVVIYQHRADRPHDGHLAHSPRRSERIRSQRHDARRLQPRADEPALQRARSADLEAARDRARLHDHRPDRRGPGRQGRGRRHAGHDLCPDHRPRRRDRRATRGWWDLAATCADSCTVQFDQFASSKKSQFLEDYPDLRVSVNDVSPFQGGSRPQTFQVNLAGPDLTKLAAYGDQLIAELKKERRDCRPRHDPLAPQARGPGDRSTARRPATWASRSARSPTPCASWSAACRSPSSAMATSNTTSGSAPSPAIAVHQPGPLPDLRFPSPTVGLVKLASLAKLDEDRGPTEIERLRPRADRHRRSAIPRAIAAGRRRQPRRADPQGDEPAARSTRYVFTGQAKTLGETGYYFLIAFALSFTVHVPDPGRPVRELDAADRDPDGAAGDDPVRHAVAGLVPHADGPLRDVRPVHAGRDRQEERHPAGRRHQPAPGQGWPRHDAIVEANHTRLRPILMTTVMLVAAMVPIALGQGPGAGSRASMAKVIIGGQMLSLVLALLVTPVFYALLDMLVNFTRRLGIRFSVEPAGNPTAKQPTLCRRRWPIARSPSTAATR